MMAVWVSLCPLLKEHVGEQPDVHPSSLLSQRSWVPEICLAQTGGLFRM